MKNYGTITDDNSLVTKEYVDSHPGGEAGWGTSAIVGDVSPIDAACLLEMSANRLLGFPTDKVMIGYTGMYSDTCSWIEAKYYEDNVISDLLGMESFIVFAKAGDVNRAGFALRIRLKISDGSAINSHLYCNVKRLMLKVYSGGMDDVYIKVRGKKIADIDDECDTWCTFAEVKVSGQPAWVGIPLDKTLGGYSGQMADHQYGELAIEMFRNDSVNVTPGAPAGIGSVRLIAPTLYFSEYELARNNMPFVIDMNGMPIFGNAIGMHESDKYATLYVDSNGAFVARDKNGEYPLFNGGGGGGSDKRIDFEYDAAKAVGGSSVIGILARMLSSQEKECVPVIGFSKSIKFDSANEGNTIDCAPGQTATLCFKFMNKSPNSLITASYITVLSDMETDSTRISVEVVNDLIKVSIIGVTPEDNGMKIQVMDWRNLESKSTTARVSVIDPTTTPVSYDMKVVRGNGMVNIVGIAKNVGINTPTGVMTFATNTGTKISARILPTTFIDGKSIRFAVAEMSETDFFAATSIRMNASGTTRESITTNDFK